MVSTHVETVCPRLLLSHLFWLSQTRMQKVSIGDRCRNAPKKEYLGILRQTLQKSLYKSVVLSTFSIKRISGE